MQFKLKGALDEGGSQTPIHHIFSGLSRGSRLITARIIINNVESIAVIDTGATASFLPRNGKILAKNNLVFHPSNILLTLGNHGQMTVKHKVKTTITTPDTETSLSNRDLHIINDTDNILGHDALIGIDIMKELTTTMTITEDTTTVEFGRSRDKPQATNPSRRTIMASITDESTKSLDFTAPQCDNEEIKTVLNRYSSVFEDSISHIAYPPMRIPLVHNYPISTKQRNHSNEERENIREQLEKLEKLDIIEPTKDSGYSFNCRVVPKKSKENRFVVNYIRLNAITAKDSYPLPLISDLLDCLSGQRIFSIMDCRDGFYQLLLHPEDRKKTAFLTPFGSRQFKRVPQGLTNSPKYFQRCMDDIFADGLYKRCAVYMDDIIIFGKNHSNHLENLDWALQRCERYNIKMKLKKCYFGQTTIDYLGYRISHNSISAIRDKVDTLNITPTNKSEVRSLLGTLNQYARFIPGYAELSAPLRNLTKNDQEFKWTPHMNTVIERIRTIFDQPLAHTIPQYDSPKKVSIHTSPTSIETTVVCQETNSIINRAGRVLTQAEQNWTDVEKTLLAITLAYEKFEHILDPEQTKFSISNEELTHTLKLKNRPKRIERLLLKLPPECELRLEIRPKPTSVEEVYNHMEDFDEIFYVDGACHRNGQPDCVSAWAVIPLFKKKYESAGIILENTSNQKAETQAAIEACRLARSAGMKKIAIITDSRYVFHAATKWIDSWKTRGWLDHRRKEVTNKIKLMELMEAKEELNIKWSHVKGHRDCAHNIMADHLAKQTLEKHLSCRPSRNTGTIASIHTITVQELKNDQEGQGILSNLDKGDPKTLEKFTIAEDALFRIDHSIKSEQNLRLYIPKHMRNTLLKIAHDDIREGGHLGTKKTAGKLLGYWWPRFYADVETYVKTCDVCQRMKTPKGPMPGYLHQLPESVLFETLHIDIVGPINPPPESGNVNVITAIDSFSRWGYARAVQEAKTPTIINFLEEEIFSRFGKPSVIKSDGGPQFTSLAWQNYMELNNIKHDITAPYNPKANGKDERFNSTLVKMLKNYADQSHKLWDQNLHHALHLYNTMVNESTGYSPFQLVYGMQPKSSLAGPTSTKRTKRPISIEELFQLKREIREEAMLNSRESFRIAKYYYDKKRQPAKFTVGQMVLYRTHTVPVGLTRKLAHKWVGPFIIYKIVGDEQNARSLELLDISNMSTKRAPIQDCKPYHTRDHEEGEHQAISKEIDVGKDGISHTSLVSITEQTLNHHSHTEPNQEITEQPETTKPASSEKNPNTSPTPPITYPSTDCDHSYTRPPQVDTTAKTQTPSHNEHLAGENATATNTGDHTTDSNHTDTDERIDGVQDQPNRPDRETIDQRMNPQTIEITETVGSEDNDSEQTISSNEQITEKGTSKEQREQRSNNITFTISPPRSTRPISWSIPSSTTKVVPRPNILRELRDRSTIQRPRWARE